MTGTDDQQGRSGTHRSGAATDGRFGDRKGCAGTEMSLFPVEFEHSLAFENEVQLLLATRALVVLLHKRLACAARDEEVNAEGVDPKRMLERVPHCVSGSPSGTIGTSAIDCTVQRAMGRA
jgi:hypothetical protein